MVLENGEETGVARSTPELYGTFDHVERLYQMQVHN